jgi:hypothetical protein
MSTKDEAHAMMKAVGVLLSASEPVRGVYFDVHGVEIGPNIPILDSHNLANGGLGHVERTWTEGDSLWGELIFTGSAGARAYRRIERGELGGCSCGLQIEAIAIRDASGDALTIDEAVARGPDDPDLDVIAQRTVLREVSITATPADKNAFVRAISFEAECWRMIRDGEETLRRILRPEPDYNVDDDDDGDDDNDGEVTLAEFMAGRSGEASRAMSPRLVLYRGPIR